MEQQVAVKSNRITLNEAIQKCVNNGHTLVDIRDDDWKGKSIVGNLAQCSECLAYLRYYKGRGMGEAYSTSCRENPRNQTLPTPTPSPTPRTIEDRTNEEYVPTIAHEIENTRPYHGYTLNDWAREIHQYARDKGWWDTPESRNFGDLMALLHTEISEAYEEYRNGHAPNERYYNNQRLVFGASDKDGIRPALPKPEGIPSELVDVMIRIFDLFGYYAIDAEAVLIEKHTYNLHRPYRHGGKVS